MGEYNSGWSAPPSGSACANCAQKLGREDKYFMVQEVFMEFARGPLFYYCEPCFALMCSFLIKRQPIQVKP